MNDTMFKKLRCDALDLTHDGQVNKYTGVRVYPSSPGHLTLQLRSYGSTRPRRGGVAKHIVSSTELDATHARNLIALLQQFVDEEPSGMLAVVTANGRTVPKSEWEANAKLIAQAPETAAQRDELLAALKAMLPENCGPADDPAGHRRPSFAKCEAARAAILRATQEGK